MARANRLVKHRLSLEHVTGLSQLAVTQDLAAKILCDNIHSLLSQAAHDAAELPTERRINRTFAVGYAALASSAAAWPRHRATTRRCPWPARAAHVCASANQNPASSNSTKAAQAHGDENMLTSRLLTVSWVDWGGNPYIKQPFMY